MDIEVKNLGKKYNYQWIFRNLNYHFKENNEYAIVGANGSGKSTLVKILSSFILPSEGEIEYRENGLKVEPDKVYKSISFASPYLELIEEFTLKEIYGFHFKFKRAEVGLEEFSGRLKISGALNKQIKFFSSGMKQRLKLGLAFFSESKVVCLDEPTSNLDSQGIEWYKEEVGNLVGQKLLIICSNQAYEYDFCKNILPIEKLT